MAALPAAAGADWVQGAPSLFSRAARSQSTARSPSTATRSPPGRPAPAPAAAPAGPPARTLGGSNTYSGGTNVNAGTLGISSDANLGNGGTVNLAAGTTLSFLTGGSYTHDVTVTGDPTFDVATGQTVTQAAVIADGATPGEVEKTGAGTLVLGADNSYTGGTIDDGGTLQLGPGGNLAAAGALTVNSGLFDLNNNPQTVSSLSGTAGTIDLCTCSLTVDQSADTSYAGTIIGTGGGGLLIKEGTGKLTLSGTNTFSDGTNLNAGTLSISRDANLGDGGRLAMGPGPPSM